MIPFVDLQAQYRAIKDEIDEAVARVLGNASFILGREVAEFEEAFAEYIGTRFCVGVSNGTAAIQLALTACGIGRGAEVIVPANTFFATAEAVSTAGARPVFVDADKDSYTIDVSQIEAAITPATRAIIPVHLYGQAADLDPILEIAARHNLLVIEDAAQAHGALYKGRRAGSLGHLSCFSFYPGKNLGAYGEAGAVVTSNAEYAEKVRVLRDHGQSRKYHHDFVGFNYRMEGIQGAVLRVKLPFLDQWTEARRRHAARYRELLKGASLRLLEEREWGTPVYHLFLVFTAQRDALQRHLQEAGVQTGIHYPIPAHLQRANLDLAYGPGDFPQTERAFSETLSLPMYPELPEESLVLVAEAVRRFEPKLVQAHA